MEFSGEPGGNAVKKQNTENFKLNETVYPSRLRQPRHTHSHASFSFILTGNYLENFGSRHFSRQPSTVIFHPPHESHSVDFGNEAVRILSVQIGFEKLAYFREKSIVFDSSTSCRTETVSWLGNRIYREFRRADAVSALAIEGLILEILAEASRCRIKDASEKSCPVWLKEARDFLRDNFAESFVFEDVVKVSGVHPIHLSRTFRRKFHYTIGEYVRRLRGEFERPTRRSVKSPTPQAFPTRVISIKLSKIYTILRLPNIAEFPAKVSLIQKCLRRSRRNAIFVIKTSNT